MNSDAECVMGPSLCQIPFTWVLSTILLHVATATVAAWVTIPKHLCDYHSVSNVFDLIDIHGPPNSDLLLGQFYTDKPKVNT